MAVLLAASTAGATKEQDRCDDGYGPWLIHSAQHGAAAGARSACRWFVE
jgi:hypothetical protein